jgi:tetratricopeptide (TPR) repeat protein
MKPSEILTTQARTKAEPLVNQGRALLDNRDFDAAVERFQAAVAIYPQYTDALQLLGIAYAQSGKWQMAVSQFKQILKLEPNNTRAHNNLGQVLDDLKDYESALASFDRAISIDPNYSAAHANRADTLARMAQNGIVSVSRPPTATAVLAPAADLPKIDYMQVAIYQYERGDKLGALSQMDLWLRAEPQNALAHLKRGILLKELRRYHEAMDNLSMAIQINPKNHEALYERGDVLQYHELFELAQTDFAAVIALKPNLAMGYEGLAGVQNALGLFTEALATIDQALAINPNSFVAQNLRNDLLLNLREHDTLLAQAKQRLHANPKSALEHTRHGKLLTHLRQFDAARSAFDKALTADAAYAPAKHGLAGLLHLQGKWADAYKVNPTGNFASNDAFIQSFGKPVWTGEQDVRGKTVLIHAELGQGDTIQLGRLASLVAKRGATVILKVQKSLVRLLSTLGGVSQVASYEDTTPPCDFICSTLALPAIFGILPSTVPYGLQPYLSVKPEWLASVQLPAKTNRRVGLVWGGGHSHYNYRRSVPLQKFVPILQMPNTEFFSFQKDHPRKELQAMSGVQITDLADQMNDFADTAALLSQMDLLISVDTSVAHVAGALGKPVWMLSRRDHPWLEGRSDNPWYASMRMYTQADFGNWDEVMSRVQHDLR